MYRELEIKGNKCEIWYRDCSRTEPSNGLWSRNMTLAVNDNQDQTQQNTASKSLLLWYEYSRKSLPDIPLTDNWHLIWIEEFLIYKRQ